MNNPLAIVKAKFGEKSKLVEAVQKFTTEDLWLGRTSKSKGLANVSNAKLLRLHDTFAAVKERFGTRVKLIDAILDLEKRAKDDGFRKRLEAFPVPRLYDMFRSADKRSKGTKKSEAGEKKAAPAAKKTEKVAAKSATPGAKKAAPAAKKAAGKAAPPKKAASSSKASGAKKR